jgi:nucleolar protein 4
VRQLPRWATESVLKRLANHAVKEFEKDVAGGKRAGLTAGELADIRVEDDKNGNVKRAGKRKKRKELSTIVKQAKVVRQNDGTDPLTGKSKSAGYGFLEMQQHRDALRVLRWVNDQTALGPLLVEWRVKELAQLIEQEKKKPKDKRDDSRLKRMQDEVKNRSTVKRDGHRRVIVEFAVENAQVVMRRRQRLIVCVIIFNLYPDLKLFQAADEKHASVPTKTASRVEAKEPLAKKRRISGSQQPRRGKAGLLAKKKGKKS